MVVFLDSDQGFRCFFWMFCWLIWRRMDNRDDSCFCYSFFMWLFVVLGCYFWLRGIIYSFVQFLMFFYLVFLDKVQFFYQVLELKGKSFVFIYVVCSVEKEEDRKYIVVFGLLVVFKNKFGMWLLCIRYSCVECKVFIYVSEFSSRFLQGLQRFFMGIFV